jgi:type IV secretion system protein VirB9
MATPLKYMSCLFAIILFCSFQAHSYNTGTPVATDSRIKTYVYNSNDVYRLLTHYGYQLSVEFSPKEQILTISVGDRSGWQIIPSGSRLFIRAMEDKAHTNMTVVTNRRAYQFDLLSSPPKDETWDQLAYVVRFYYPEDEKRLSPVKHKAKPYAARYTPPTNNFTPAAPPTSTPNYNYTYTGSSELIPLEIYDNSQSTFIRFSDEHPVPTLYVTMPDSSLTALPFVTHNQYLVTKGVYPQIELRLNGKTATVYNENTQR